MNEIPTLTTIRAAAACIQPYLNKTPVLTSQSLDALAAANLFFKCENFQRTGSFKMRGAANVVFGLSADEMQYGVATQSSGNHGQALALAAKLRNIPAYIVMPTNAAQVKKDAVLAYQGKIIDCEANLAAREQMVEKVLQETNAHYVAPYNDYRIIAGQATAALELLKEVPNLDIIIAPVGGGGLVSGTALVTHYLSPKTQIIAAEPKEADDAFRSFYSGTMQANKTTKTIADGLRSDLREKTFGIICQYVHQVCTVEEEQIVQAMKLIWQRMKIIIEPSCAVPLAAVLSQKIEDYRGKRIGIILTGGNVDFSLDFLQKT
jgi:threonine dehydratase